MMSSEATLTTDIKNSTYLNNINAAQHGSESPSRNPALHGTSRTDSSEEESLHKTSSYPCFISSNWSLSYYISPRGAENFHIYLWIIKDFSWMQGFYYPSVLFGSLALVWCAVLALHTFEQRNVEECYMLVAVFLWLYGNFWWMYGEIVNEDDAIHQPEAGDILLTALAIIAFFHIVLQPLGIIKHSTERSKAYQDAGLIPRFSYFKSWRQYEHVHTFFWCGKDFSWNIRDRYTWVIFLIPTLAIACDFIWCSFWTKRMMVDTLHYVAVLMWVIGNLLWAYSEIFLYDEDDAIYIFNNPLSHYHSGNASLYDDDYMFERQPFRWYASWTLFGAFIPIILLYIIWLPLTAFGLIPSEVTSNPTSDVDTKSVDAVTADDGSSTITARSEVSPIHSSESNRDGIGFHSI